MKKYILFSLLFSLACLVWQCGNDDNGNNPTPDTSPTITSFTPTSGGIGATVTITGTNFSTTASSNVVKFNGTVATVSSATATSITTTVPTGATTGKITVEVAGKTATSASDFTFIRYATVSTLAGGGTGSTDGTGTNAKFSYPYGIVRDSQGNLFVTDFSNNTIRKITPQGVVTTFAGTAGQSGNTDGTGATARFNGPGYMCIDASNNLYVVDGNGNRVRKITPTGEVTTFAGSTTATGGNVDGQGTVARFNNIKSITINTQGTLYVMDGGNNKIRNITPAGAVTTLFNNFGAGNVLYMSPQNVLYLAINRGLGIVNQTNGVMAGLLAGGSTTGFADGTGTNAKFNLIAAMSADTEGNLYVTDQSNYRIRKVTPAGVVTTVAGSGTSGLTDGGAAEATFTNLIGISASNNNLYVVEASPANKIRKIE
jgi:sugar lactone lactonase YvrE